MLRIAILTDIHAAKQHGTKHGNQAVALLEQTLQSMMQHEPDLLLDLGDRINDINPETDMAALQSLATIFAQTQLPKVHLLGNHDVVNLSPQQNAEVLGSNTHSHVLAVGEWNLVMWFCNPVLTDQGWSFFQTDLEWLQVALTTKRPSAIFTHAPFAGASMLGNYYFEPLPHLGGYAPSQELRQILENSTVELCVAGHCHWNTLTYLDGIAHVTIQSLTEGFTTQNQAAQSWAMLELGDTIKLEVFGLDKRSHLLPRRTSGLWLKQPH
jgi:3',5'-cyclic-AMP phosphodiesterase